jgi:CRP-like cAMP-binding protein
MVDKDVLAQIPLFADLDESQLRQIALWFNAQNVSPGMVLTGQGASGYSFYVLVDGSAAVTLGNQQVAELGPGDFFGEGAIVGDGRRGATVTTTEPSEVLVMFGTEFRRMQQAHPNVAAAIEEVGRQRVEADAGL